MPRLIESVTSPVGPACRAVPQCALPHVDQVPSGRRDLLAVTPIAPVLLLLSLGCSQHDVGHSVSAEVKTQNTALVGQGPLEAIAIRPHSDVSRLVASEELILRLAPELQRLAQSVLNLRLPDHNTRQLFVQRVTVTDLQQARPARGDRLINSAAELFAWPVPSGQQVLSGSELSLWKALFSQTSYFEHARFDITRGCFSDEGLAQFDTEIDFHGLARTTEGRWRSVSASQLVRWSRQPDDAGGQAPRWQITDWRVTQLSGVEGERILFTESLDELLPDPSTLERARESVHWRMALNHYYPRFRASLPGKYGDRRFFVISTALHPGLSVVDINGDGWDDLYVTERWGKNMLFANRGDGKFDEVAGRYGLDIEGRSNAAIFADFDNDGDPDLVLARSFERSMYLVNENGHFVDRSESLVSQPLPFQATSVSAADYNLDGLLDVYFCTYHQDDVSSRIDADMSNPAHPIHELLTKEQSEELKQRHRQENRSYLTQVGPPNVLLVNRGAGRFDVAKESEQLALWRNSFQATWADYDDDGDVDLYVANDFAPDNLLRNDMPDGFVDVTDPMQANTMGFAMGASWGDYDNDGRQDLYVSNMHSKAGDRITSQIAGLDPRIRQLSAGNYVYRNLGQAFEQVAGLEPPRLAVAKAGWSWGGQLADIDNDGYLDIYVASGYYSVPDQFTTNIDL